MAAGTVPGPARGRRVPGRRAGGPPGAAGLRRLPVEAAQLDILVPQRDSGTRPVGLVGLALGLLFGFRQPLPDPGPEGQLEVEPGGDGRGRAVRSRGDVALRRLHHLQHQAGVERMGGVDVLGEPVRVDERRVGRHVAFHIVGHADHHEQLHIGAQPLGAGLADGDGALHRHLRLGPLGRMRASQRQVDGGGGGQPLGGGHERLGLVPIVGALGLTQQCGDPRQHLVVRHTAIRFASRLPSCPRS